MNNLSSTVIAMKNSNVQMQTMRDNEIENFKVFDYFIKEKKFK